MSKATWFAFIAGAAVGSVATWQFVKKKYERIAQEEIDSVTAHFASKDELEYHHSGEIVGEVEKVEKDEDGVCATIRNPKPSIVDYVKKMQEEGYVDYSAMMNSPKPDEESARPPYVISPDDFGEFEEYQKISLTYFEDQVLADDNNEIVENVEELVGFASLTHFGEFEDDAVHVRNERLKCDFEILKDLRLYANVVADRGNN